MITVVRYHGATEEEGVGFGASLRTQQNFPKMYGLFNRETVHSLQLKIQHQLHVPYHKQQLNVGGMQNPPDPVRKITKDKFDKISLQVLD